MERHAIPDKDIRESLAKRGLECHLLMEPRDANNALESFRASLCAELKPVLEAAYARKLTEAHLLHETWAVTLRQIEAPHAVVACATLQFIPNYPCCFHTHFEAVHPDNQGVGLGRMLYDCLAAWARFLAVNDPLVLHMILRSNNEYYLVSTIDREDGLDADEEVSDNTQGHGTFLKKLGFVRAQHDFGQDIDVEIAFQRPFAIPRSCSDPFQREDSPSSPRPALLEREDSIAIPHSLPTTLEREDSIAIPHSLPTTLERADSNPLSPTARA